MKNIVD